MALFILLNFFVLYDKIIKKIILLFSFILAIINPNSQIDNSPVIPNNIHNFLIVLIFVLFFLINIETILFLFTNLFNMIYD